MGRRGNGEGTIRKRDLDGRWEGRLFLGYENGKKKFRYFYGKTRREVQEQLVKGQNDLQQGIVLDTSKWSVEQYLKRWLDNVVKSRVKHRTWLSYEQHIRLYLIPNLGPIRLTNLGVQHIESMDSRMLKTVSPRTAHHAHAVLKNALNQAVKSNLLARNVATLADSPRVSRHEIVSLTLEQVQALLRAAAGDRLEVLYLLALCTGLRAGELLGLRWSDVNLDAARLQIRATLNRYRGPWQLTEPKSASSRRAISLPTQAVSVLKEHRLRQFEERMVAERWEDNGLVFCTTVGTPLSLTNVHRRSFKPLLERAGLPNIRFHDLRHTAASLLLAEGEHP